MKGTNRKLESGVLVSPFWVAGNKSVAPRPGANRTLELSNMKEYPQERPNSFPEPEPWPKMSVRNKKPLRAARPKAGLSGDSSSQGLSQPRAVSSTCRQDSKGHPNVGGPRGRSGTLLAAKEEQSHEAIQGRAPSDRIRRKR